MKNEEIEMAMNSMKDTYLEEIINEHYEQTEADVDAAVLTCGAVVVTDEDAGTEVVKAADTVVTAAVLSDAAEVSEAGDDVTAPSVTVVVRASVT